MKNSIFVRADWDPEAQVFVATSEDVPGLVAEAASSQELVEKLNTLIPELLEMNCSDIDGSNSESREIPLYIIHQTISKIRVYA